MRSSRFVFVAALVLSLAGVVGSSCGDASLHNENQDETTQGTGALSGTRLRLMAANISSGNDQSYTPGHGARIFEGCHPDIVMLQEFNYGTDSDTDIRAFVTQTFGADFSYVRGAPNQIPNGIISRYPIIAGGDWNDTQVSNRDFTWAHIDVPGPTDLWAISVHLLTSGAGARSAESAALVKYIQANVPAGDYVVIGGDLNSSSRTEAAVTKLSAIFSTSGPYPVDQKGNDRTNAGRNKPYDWVLVSPALQALATPTIIGGSTFANGFVADTRVYSPIADLSPALSSDSAASSMQHMAIVRDFNLPTTTTASVRVVSPNGGEIFTAGTTQAIRWVSSNIDTVDVAYSVDGLNYATFASAVTASTGTVSWVVPASATSAGRVRVIDSKNATDPTRVDSSDAAFSIDLASTVRVTSPNGSEAFAAGSTQTVTWQSQNIATVDVAYSVDGLNYVTFASAVTASTGTVSWSVSTTATTSGFIRVSSSAKPSVSDVSDAAFTVQTTPPTASIVVDAPNGGESFTAGSIQTIRWSSTSVSTVDVAYSADGVTFTRLASSISATPGSLSWTVPAGATTKARVRVSDAPTAMISDVSDAAFTVTATTGGTAQVILNEILANEPGSATAGEFVELFNAGTGAADVSGWSVSDAAQVRHTFAAGTSLAAGATLVVYGNLSAAPSGIAVVGASTGTLGLSNSGDTVKLTNASQTTVDSFTYTSTLSSTDGVSMNRSPDRTAGAAFVLHSTVSASLSSAGTSVNGSP